MRFAVLIIFIFCSALEVYSQPISYFEIKYLDKEQGQTLFSSDTTRFSYKEDPEYMHIVPVFDQLGLPKNITTFWNRPEPNYAEYTRSSPNEPNRIIHFERFKSAGLIDSSYYSLSNESSLFERIIYNYEEGLLTEKVEFRDYKNSGEWYSKSVTSLQYDNQKRKEQETYERFSSNGLTYDYKTIIDYTYTDSSVNIITYHFNANEAYNGEHHILSTYSDNDLLTYEEILKVNKSGDEIYNKQIEYFHTNEILDSVHYRFYNSLADLNVDKNYKHFYTGSRIDSTHEYILTESSFDSLQRYVYEYDESDNLLTYYRSSYNNHKFLNPRFHYVYNETGSITNARNCDVLATCDEFVDMNIIYDSELSPVSSVMDQVKIDLYPNPSRNTIYYKCELAIDGYRMYNIYGQLIRQLDINQSAIDISDLQTGLYSILFISGDVWFEKKFIKY